MAFRREMKSLRPFQKKFLQPYRAGFVPESGQTSGAGTRRWLSALLSSCSASRAHTTSKEAIGLERARQLTVLTNESLSCAGARPARAHVRGLSATSVCEAASRNGGSG